MSVGATTWAWSQKTESSGQRLVLLALADAAGGDEDDPRVCWPSIARVSRMTGIGESTVKLHMERLADVGLITKVERRRRRDGTLGTWTITVNFLPFTTADPSALVEPTTADPSALDHSRPIGSHEPSLPEPSENTSRASHAVDGFGAFWKGYPRHIAQPAAKRAWAKLSKPDQATALDALPLWRAFYEARNEPEFIPYPQKWLNQRYFDSPPPPLPGAKRAAPTVGFRDPDDVWFDGANVAHRYPEQEYRR